jgi:hypothetical protein
MYRSIQILFIVVVVAFATGCRVETYSDGYSNHDADGSPDNYVLQISYQPVDSQYSGWAAVTAMLFDFHHMHYSQTDVVDFHYFLFGHDSASIDEINWLLWDLGDVDSAVTGTLSFDAIRAEINSGNPVLLQYGDYYEEHYMVLHGYDENGYVYLHDPAYGTRVVYYGDLYDRYFEGTQYHWVASLTLSD